MGGDRGQATSGSTASEETFFESDIGHQSEMVVLGSAGLGFVVGSLCVIPGSRRLGWRLIIWWIMLAAATQAVAFWLVSSRAELVFGLAEIFGSLVGESIYHDLRLRQRGRAVLFLKD